MARGCPNTEPHERLTDVEALSRPGDCGGTKAGQGWLLLRPGLGGEPAPRSCLTS